MSNPSVWQVAVNIGMVTGVLPVVGVTLPLISYGGSSALTVMLALGPTFPDGFREGGMSLPREVLPGRTYMVTRRCSERRFFLRPDHATNNAFIYCLAMAAARTGASPLIETDPPMDQENGSAVAAIHP